MYGCELGIIRSKFALTVSCVDFQPRNSEIEREQRRG